MEITTVSNVASRLLADFQRMSDEYRKLAQYFMYEGTDIPGISNHVDSLARLLLEKDGIYELKSQQRRMEGLRKAICILLNEAISEIVLQEWRGDSFPIKRRNAYENSKYWKLRRKILVIYADYACQLCNTHLVASADLHVHHRTYENLGTERISDLFVLCSSHHLEYHVKLNQTPRSIQEG